MWLGCWDVVGREGREGAGEGMLTLLYSLFIDCLV